MTASFLRGLAIMVHPFRFLAVLIGALVALTGGPLPADQPPASESAVKKTTPHKFIRIQRDSSGQPTALETAVVRFASKSGDGGLVVDLVSAVHVADRAYYEKLNERLDQYDVVLYELVAPEGTRIPKGGRRNSDNPIAFLQQLATLVLDLDLQTELIDYTRKHFVHADLSPEQMAEAIHNRGDDGVTLFLSIAADLLRQQNRQELKKGKSGQAAEDVDLLSMVLDPDGAAKLKRLMAEQMEALESPDGGIGATLSTILIADRNKAAMKVLGRELAKGKKKIAIFFGAAHMPDFEKRLVEDFGLTRKREEWLQAWDMQGKKRSVLDLLKMLDR
jgi:hypothetical protein